jgi:hypothetical protein
LREAPRALHLLASMPGAVLLDAPADCEGLRGIWGLRWAERLASSERGFVGLVMCSGIGWVWISYPCAGGRCGLTALAMRVLRAGDVPARCRPIPSRMCARIAHTRSWDARLVSAAKAARLGSARLGSLAAWNGRESPVCNQGAYFVTFSSLATR